MVPGGNQIVPGALGGGCGQNGRGDLQKALLGHQTAQLGHHLTAQDDVALHRGIPQVEIAVLQTDVLVGIPALVDLKGQLAVAALAQHGDGAGNHFDLAGGQLGVLALPLPDDAGDGNGGFLGDGLDDFHHFFGFHHHLRGAVKVPDHEKREVRAHLADVLQPTDNGDFLTGVCQPQLAAVMGSGLGHGKFPLILLFNLHIISQTQGKVNHRNAFR